MSGETNGERILYQMRDILLPYAVFNTEFHPTKTEDTLEKG